MTQLQTFKVFCPKVLAGIGELPDTIADRAIPIRLKRRARREYVERFRYRDVRADAVPIQEAITPIMSSIISLLAEARPAIPDELHDRAADYSEPLLAIADAASGEWPMRARTALVALCSEVPPEDDSLAIRLLADTKTIFDQSGLDRILSKDLRRALLEIEDAPWSDLYGGKEISGRRMARLLSPYGPRSHDIRIRNTEAYAETFPGAPFVDHGKGYERGEFEDAWERYVSTETPSIRDIGDKNPSYRPNIPEMSRMSPIEDLSEVVPEEDLPDPW